MEEKGVKGIEKGKEKERNEKEKRESKKKGEN